MLEILLPNPDRKTSSDYQWLFNDSLLSTGNVNNMVANGPLLYSNIEDKKAISFNDQRGVVTDKEITLNLNGWTYSAEINVANYNRYGHFLTAATGQDSFALKIATQTANIPGGSVYVYTSATGSRISKLRVPLNKWSKLQIVYKPNNVKFYLDGNLVDTMNFTLPASVGAIRKYLIGRYQISTLAEGMDFSIRNVNLFLRALEENELKNI